MPSDKEKESWTIDQITKSEFFREKGLILVEKAHGKSENLKLKDERLLILGSKPDRFIV